MAHYDNIVRPVVAFIAIDMMDMLSTFQFPTKFRLSNNAMLVLPDIGFLDLHLNVTPN